MATQTFTYAGWQDLQTLQSKEILSELMEAKEHRLAKLLISETGLGKSHTVKLFTSKLPNNTFRVVVGDSFKLQDVVDEILYQIGVDVWSKHRRSRDKLKIITEHMRGLSVADKPIIIIDEAENLKPNSLRMMKELYDAIIDRSSIVLIATPQILDTIHNKAKRNRTGVPQLWRRFKAGTRYISELNRARDFKPFYTQYIPDQPDLQDLLNTTCENYGELHDYLDPALRFCQQKKQLLTEEIFRLFHKLPKQQQRRK